MRGGFESSRAKAALQGSGSVSGPIVMGLALGGTGFSGGFSITRPKKGPSAGVTAAKPPAPTDAAISTEGVRLSANSCTFATSWSKGSGGLYHSTLAPVAPPCSVKGRTTIVRGDGPAGPGLLGSPRLDASLGVCQRPEVTLAFISMATISFNLTHASVD